MILIEENRIELRVNLSLFKKNTHTHKLNNNNNQILINDCINNTNYIKIIFRYKRFKLPTGQQQQQYN